MKFLRCTNYFGMQPVLLGIDKRSNRLRYRSLQKIKRGGGGGGWDGGKSNQINLKFIKLSLILGMKFPCQHFCVSVTANAILIKICTCTHEVFIYVNVTWMIATRSTSPRRPTAKHPIAMVTGPAMNRRAMPNNVKLVPQARTFSCVAMKIPTIYTQKI